jgi:hypothetical protein
LLLCSLQNTVDQDKDTFLGDHAAYEVRLPPRSAPQIDLLAMRFAALFLENIPLSPNFRAFLQAKGSCGSGIVTQRQEEVRQLMEMAPQAGGEDIRWDLHPRFWGFPVVGLPCGSIREWHFLTRTCCCRQSSVMHLSLQASRSGKGWCVRSKTRPSSWDYLVGKERNSGIYSNRIDNHVHVEIPRTLTLRGIRGSTTLTFTTPSKFAVFSRRTPLSIFCSLICENQTSTIHHPHSEASTIPSASRALPKYDSHTCTSNCG